MRCLLRGKIHRATVTDANVDYVGSISIDQDLLRKADIWPGEKVLIADINNGARFETYTLEAKAGSGEVCINGAAARLVRKGDKVIIMAFEYSDKPIVPNVVIVDENNRHVKTIHNPGAD